MGDVIRFPGGNSAFAFPMDMGGFAQNLNAFGQPGGMPNVVFGVQPRQRLRTRSNFRSGGRSGSRPAAKRARSTKAKKMINKTGVQTKVKEAKSKKKGKNLSLKKRLQRLEKYQKLNPHALFTYKRDLGVQLLIDPGKAGYKYTAMWDPATIEQCIDGVRYVTTATPNVASTIDMTSVTANQKLPIKCWTKFFFKNNHNMPLDFIAYVIEFKGTMTSIDAGAPTIVGELAADLARGGLANVAAGDALEDNPQFFPSDSERWKKEVRVLKTYKLRLEAGDEFSLSSSKTLIYNQERYDTEGGTTKYINAFTRGLLVRITGVVAHDETTTTNVGWGDGGIDYIRRQKMVVYGVDQGVKTDQFEAQTLASLTTPVIAGVDTIIEKEDQ